MCELMKTQFCEAIIDDKIINKDWKHLEEILRTETEWVSNALALKDEIKKKREAVEQTNFAISMICKIIRELRTQLESSVNDEILLLAAQCFRSLRNLSALSSDNQIHIACRTHILSETGILLKKFVTFLRHNSNENVDKCMLTLLQFLGNNVVQNSITADLIWCQFKNEIMACLYLTNHKLANVSAMIIYNVLISDAHIEVENIPQIITALEQVYSSEHQYPQLLFEHFIENSQKLLCPFYEDLPFQVKLLILEITKEMFRLEIEIPKEYLSFISMGFKKKSDAILKTVSSYVENVEPQEVVNLLNVIATGSSLELYQPFFQEDKSLFINCVFLLRAIHSLGKESENNFTGIHRLADLTPGNASRDIENHIAYGFKALLIRTIGNLLWRHPENQKQIRELECIPVLLDCCNMDARNPLIMQWVVLAIRSLCENCPENQAIIAAMSRKSPAFSKTLSELGIKLQ